MKTRTYLDSMQRLRELWRRKRYKRAHDKLSSLLESGVLTANCLVFKATLMSVSDDIEGDLQEISELYRAAVQIEPTSLDALLELAYHTNAVLDNPRKAKEQCENILHICREYEKKAKKLILECRRQMA